MYIDILKKDLNRKKVSNMIVFIFVILSSMFVSSSVSNVRTIMTSLDRFMDEANVQDYYMMAMDHEKNLLQIEEFLSETKTIDSWNKEDLILIESQNIVDEGKERVELTNLYWLTSLEATSQNFFDSDDKKIDHMEEGEAYIIPKASEEMNIYPGETIYIKITKGDEIIYKELTIKGIMKDAVYDSSFMGGGRFLVSNTDYKYFKEELNLGSTFLYTVETNDVESFERVYHEQTFERLGAFSRDMVELTYFIDMVIAGILLIVSICLILIAILILRFILKFSISEEFREIGIMKAIGIKNRKIRTIYGIKYFTIAVLGSIIGYFAAIPFSKILLESAAKNCMLVADDISNVLALLSSVMIAILVIIFSFISTKPIKKLSPIDAIRNGQDGNRYKKKGFIKLGKTKMQVGSFLACNDVFGYLRRYIVLFFVFILGTILIIVPAISADTLQSDAMVEMVGLHESDVFLVDMEGILPAFNKGEMDSYAKDELLFIEKLMDELNYPGRAFYNMIYQVNIKKGDLSALHNAYQGIGIAASEFPILEGRNPEYVNEVSLTEMTASTIDAKIGDTVWINIGEKSEKMAFVVTGYFQTMNNMGQGVRFYEDFDLTGTTIMSVNNFQYEFAEDLSKREINKRIDKIREAIPQYTVNTTSEYLRGVIGNAGDQVNQVKWIILFVMTGIDMLVTVLMVKSFVLRDRTEVALLKAMGFSNKNIISIHVKRIAIIILLSTAIGIALSNPVAQISSAKVFMIMGASRITFAFDPIQSLILYPLIVICSTLLASLLATLQICSIKPSEVNSIE